MELSDYREKVAKLMKEAGYQAYGTQNPPVQQAVWPDTSAQVDPAKATVTDGSTTELGAPRSDIQAQENGGSFDPEAMGEVASLLISIGFILQQAGVVQDKYDVQGILSCLSDNFSNLSMDQAPEDVAPEAEVDVVAVDPNAAPQPPTEAPVDAQNVDDMQEKKQPMNPYMESRKLLESKFKNFKKKK